VGLVAIQETQESLAIPVILASQDIAEIAVSLDIPDLAASVVTADTLEYQDILASLAIQGLAVILEIAV
jgi:hypothetical protein